LDCQVKIKTLEKLREDKFRCTAAFEINKRSAVSQNNIPDELAFSFKLKDFESPSGCDALEETQLRKCWELELPLSFQ